MTSKTHVTWGKRVYTFSTFPFLLLRFTLFSHHFKRKTLIHTHTPFCYKMMPVRPPPRADELQQDIRFSACSKQERERISQAIHSLYQTSKLYEAGEWIMEQFNVPRINWGKYKGQPIKSLPKDYVEWILTKSDCPDQGKDFIKRNYY